ncbi:MAG: hypothetical protein V3U52_08800 [Thermoplasmata archaeon]
MTKESAKKTPASELREVLQGQGYALNISTERKGDVLTAKLELLDVKEDRSLLRLVASGRLEDINLALGFQASEEAVWELILRFLNLLGTGRT